ncbi:unnamed protein product [Amoebophrya sp. A25]|nr:unnamed protein product [Amoebophrya sp. A25]|eukprot:GSA25T00026135001.1
MSDMMIVHVAFLFVWRIMEHDLTSTRIHFLENYHAVSLFQRPDRDPTVPLTPCTSATLKRNSRCVLVFTSPYLYTHLSTPSETPPLSTFRPIDSRRVSNTVFLQHDEPLLNSLVVAFVAGVPSARRALTELSSSCICS